jgi:hypothetical protein
MKSRLVSIMAFLGLVVAAQDASAGRKDTTPVVSISGGNFQGALGVVRNTANTVEYIGCWTNGNGVADCFAKDAAGNAVECSTSTAGIVAAIRAMNSDSLISVGSSNGTCTSVSVFTRSEYAPKSH